MKFKLFIKANPLARKGENQSALEKEVNQWLEENPGIKIVDIRQSASGGGGGAGSVYAIGSAIYISIWYEPAPSAD
ncbi:MAG: hypothetical protein R6U89_02810 [Dehalococcoidia bacterium]